MHDERSGRTERLQGQTRHRKRPLELTQLPQQRHDADHQLLQLLIRRITQLETQGLQEHRQGRGGLLLLNQIGVVGDQTDVFRMKTATLGIHRRGLIELLQRSQQSSVVLEQHSRSDALLQSPFVVLLRCGQITLLVSLNGARQSQRSTVQR